MRHAQHNVPVIKKNKALREKKTQKFHRLAVITCTGMRFSHEKNIIFCRHQYQAHLFCTSPWFLSLLQILCLSCLLYKRWSDAEATRLFYFFEKSSREWPLLNNITRNGAGSLFADVTFGGYIIICVALYIAYLMGELKNSKKTVSPPDRAPIAVNNYLCTLCTVEVNRTKWKP